MTKRERWREVAEEIHVGWPPNAVADFHAACQRIATIESAAMRLVRAVLSGERTPEQDRAAAEVWRLVENESPPSQ